MAEVTNINTGKWSPEQAIREAKGIQDEMAHVAIIWMEKGDLNGTPHLTCSSMRPVDMNFLGFALQEHSLSHMKDND